MKPNSSQNISRKSHNFREGRQCSTSAFDQGLGFWVCFNFPHRRSPNLQIYTLCWSINHFDCLCIQRKLLYSASAKMHSKTFGNWKVKNSVFESQYGDLLHLCYEEAHSITSSKFAYIQKHVKNFYGLNKSLWCSILPGPFAKHCGCCSSGLVVGPVYNTSLQIKGPEEGSKDSCSSFTRILIL